MSQEGAIADNKVVQIAYELRLDDDDVIDRFSSDDPLEYLHGHGHIIPGLESALSGRITGDSLQVSIDPADGFGYRDEEKMVLLPLDSVPDDLEVTVGQELLVGDDEDEESVSTAFVSEIRDDGILIDLNHPLAGFRLNFSIQVVGVRNATAEELEHGHVHSEGHHH